MLVMTDNDWCWSEFEWTLASALILCPQQIQSCISENQMGIDGVNRGDLGAQVQADI